MLSPLLKLDIDWKAECLAAVDDSLGSDGNESLSDRGDGSIADFKFRLRSADNVVPCGIECRGIGIGRTSLGDELVSRFLCPNVKFSIGFSTGVGNTAEPTVLTGQAGTREKPPGWQGSGNGCDWEAVS